MFVPKIVYAAQPPKQYLRNTPIIHAISAGTNADAETPISGDLIEWADIIFVMEKMHKTKISKKFPSLLKDKRLICLAY